MTGKYLNLDTIRDLRIASCIHKFLLYPKRFRVVLTVVYQYNAESNNVGHMSHSNPVLHIILSSMATNITITPLIYCCKLFIYLYSNVSLTILIQYTAKDFVSMTTDRET